MTKKPANKARGEVALPMFGEGVFIRLTIDALERLEGEYDANEKGWLLTVIDGISARKISVIKHCIACGVDTSDELDWSQVRNLDELAGCVLDALFLILYDKTFAEQKEVEEQKAFEETANRLKKISSDPHLAALVSLRQSAELATSQDSDLTMSAASPQ